MLHLFIPVGIFSFVFSLSVSSSDRNSFKDTTQILLLVYVCVYSLLNVIVLLALGFYYYINTKLFLCVCCVQLQKVKVFFAQEWTKKEKYRLSITFIIVRVVDKVPTRIHCHAKGQIISNYFIYCFLLRNFFFVSPHILSYNTHMYAHTHTQ